MITNWNKTINLNDLNEALILNRLNDKDKVDYE